MSFTLDRQEILNVALRNKYASVDAYLLGLGADQATQDLIDAVANRIYRATNDIQSLLYTELQPAKLSSTLIKLSGEGGSYIQFAGSGFKFSSSGNLVEKFENFSSALFDLAGDPATTLKYITVGTAGGSSLRADFSASQIKLTVGTDVIRINGDFPTKLGQIYKIVEEVTGLNSTTGFDPDLFKLLAIKPGSELAKLDIDSASLTVGGAQLANVVLNDSTVRLTVGKTAVEVTGNFPDNAAEIYMAARSLVKVDRSGDFPMFDFVTAISAGSTLHDYNVDTISIRSEGVVVASASFTTSLAVLQLGELRLILRGEFPNTAADVAQLVIDYNNNGGYYDEANAVGDFSLASLKLVDTKDGSVLASTSGVITGSDLANIFTTLTYNIFEGNGVQGTSGVDKIYGDSNGDYIETFEGNDIIYGRAGNDNIGAGAGIDYVYGDAGNDTIYAQDGADKVDGGSGNDLIYGGAGSDWIVGGAGADTLYGEAGGDRFVFRDLGEISARIALWISASRSVTRLISRPLMPMDREPGMRHSSLLELPSSQSPQAKFATKSKTI
jgi:Ca2+-binding RTX toxin-like protein